MKTKNTTGEAPGRILPILATLLLLAALVLPVSAFQLGGQDVSAPAPGAIVEYPVILDEAPSGLAGYSLTVQLADPAIGEITAVTFPGWATLNQKGALPADSVTIKAADLNDGIPAGATGITLATLSLRADSAGTTPVVITLRQMDDDLGGVMSPAIQAGSFTVAGLPTPTPTETGTPEPTPTTTTPPQPVAAFSADPLTGLAPLTVRFTDASADATAFAWDFESDGTVDSTEQNPQHTYPGPGTYSVTLTATGPGGSDEEVKQAYITVTAEPTPTPTTTQTPVHTVPAVTAGISGDTVVMNWERIDDADLLGYKVVVAKGNPDPAYPADGYMYYITDRDTTTVTISAGDPYLGGDVGGAIEAGATYYFSITALYEPYTPVAGNAIPLTVPGGVTPTPTPTPVPVPVAGFFADPLSGTVPLTVQYTDTSTGDGLTYEWDLDGDNIVDSTAQNPSYTYSAAGHYTARLTVSNAGGSDYEVKPDYIAVTQAVALPVAGFSADPRSGTAPLTVTFTDASSNAISFAWDFGDGQSSTEQSPVHVYAVPGVYTVTLTATNADGADNEIKADYIAVGIAPPVADFTADFRDGTAPFTVRFTDRSTGDAITSYSWDFGDGQGSSEQNPLHTFAAPGMYTVQLTVANSGGSDDEVKADYITANVAAPVAGFSADPRSGTAPLTVMFTDQSAGDSIAGYAWDFENDGTVDSTAQNPSFTYAAAGTYTVKLTVTNPGGSGDEVKTDYISVTVAPPTAGFAADTTSGTAPLTVTFSDQSTGDGITTYAWDFGDGQVSSEQNPQHVYAAAGTYTVNLTVANAGGSDDEVRPGYITVTVAPPVAGFDANVTSGVIPLAVLFGDRSTGDAITSYAWDFESDGIIDSSEQNPVHVFTAAGTYNVSLVVANAGGSDQYMAMHYLTARPVPPVANFSANMTGGYAPLTVSFGDRSTGDAITSYAWDFEDDGIVDTADQNPVHTFMSPGNFTVNLTVTNAGGTDTMIRTEYIRVAKVPPPVAAFSANLSTGIVPVTVQFTDESTGLGLISWAWDFQNDGTVDSTDQNPVYTYSAPGTYNVSLTVTGTGGQDDEVKNAFITVSEKPPAAPQAEFVANQTSGKAPLTVRFTDKSLGKNITSYAWDFQNDGTVDSTDQNPVFTYASPGKYSVKLTVANAGGSNTTVKKNYLKVSALAKPEADFKANPVSGKAPLTVKFTDKSKGEAITEYSWDFNNDGKVDSTEKNPTYTYASAGKFAVRLVVTNAAGTDMEIKSDFISVQGSAPPSDKKPIAVIFASKTWGTPPMTVKFADQSRNDPTSRTWFFGDGTSSTEKNPTHFYGDPGIYFVRLYVENSAGTDMDWRVIFVLPKWMGFMVNNWGE